MRPAALWPEAPYPGARPEGSYVLVGDAVLEFACWDGDLAGRVPLLSYGSNACPSKLARLREEYGLPGPVVMTACAVEGMAAAWCTGVRRHDGRAVATLVAAPGAEPHFLWWVAADQWRALDACEGRPYCYDLTPLQAVVRDADGSAVPGVVAYVGVGADRLPRRRDDGTPVLLRETGHAPADELFVYGTLMPSQIRWPLLDPYVLGEPAPDRVAGRLLDTGRGYPALVDTRGGGVVHGWRVRLSEPATVLDRLDAVEGTDAGLFARVPVLTASGRWCWTYEYCRDPGGLADLGGRWP